MSGTGIAATPMLIGGAAVAAVVAGGAVWYSGRTASDVQAITPAVQVETEAVQTSVGQVPATPAPSAEGGTQLAAVSAAPEAPASDVSPQVAPAIAPDVAASPGVPTAGTSASLPRLDEVRLDQGGIAVIAGRASPFAEVVLRVDGSEVARTAADGRGAFATVAMLDPSDTARILTLAEIGAEGAERASLDELILAPVRTAPDAPQVASITQQLDQPQAPSVPEADVAVSTPAVQGADTTSQAEAVQSAPSVQASLAEQPDAPDVPTASASRLSQTDAAPVLPESTAPSANAEVTDQVAILRSGPEGVEVVQPLAPTPDVMDQILLDAISYSAQGEVELAGRAQSTTREVRVYLDNRPIAALSVNDSGDWRGELPDVDSGIYTLRLDEVADDGKVTSRVETPFKREEPETLVAAVEAAADSPVTAITVQAGATLWAIARERYGDGLLYVQVFEANREAIRNPDLIYPGQVFALPD